MRDRAKNDMYKAVNNETSEIVELTEDQVREEIYETASSGYGDCF